MKTTISISSVRRQLKPVRHRVSYLIAARASCPVGNQTELSTGNAKVDLTKNRRNLREWIIGASTALLLIVGGVFGQMAFAQGQEEKRENATPVVEQPKEYVVNPKQLRNQIVQSIEKTYEMAVSNADSPKEEWESTEDVVNLAKQQRDDNLSRVDGFLKSIVAEVKSGNASPEFIKFARTLQEEGADEAIAYISLKEKEILDPAKTLLKKAEETKLEARKILAPLLETARLLANKGQYEKARDQLNSVLENEPTWPEALHVQIWNLLELGDLSTRYKTVDGAIQIFLEAEKLAQRLASGAQTHAESKRDLSISSTKLGDTYLMVAKLEEALQQYEKSLKILQRLADADPSNSRKQRDLSILLERLGDAHIAYGQTEEAIQRFEKVMEISHRLAKADPSDAQNQRDLMVCHYKIGNMHFENGDYIDAIESLNQGIAALDRLIAKKQDIAQAKSEKALLEDLIADCKKAKKIEEEEDAEWAKRLKEEEAPSKDTKGAEDSE